MAFDKSKFSVLAHTGDVSQFVYKDTAETTTNMAAPAFFGELVDDGILSDGDTVVLVGSNGTALGAFANTGDAALIDVVPLVAVA